MASGDVLATSNRLHERVILLEDIGAPDNGVWVDCRGFSTGLVTVTGITTATVQIRGSNETAKPAAATHAAQIGADITADSGVQLTALPAWIKARVSAFTSGTIRVIIQMHAGNT